MTALSRREIVALLILSLPVGQLLLLVEALAKQTEGEKPDRRRSPAENNRENRFGDRHNDAGSRSERAARSDPPESRLRDREKRATGDRQKEYSKVGDKKRERAANERNIERQERATTSEEKRPAESLDTSKMKEQKALTKATASEKAGKGKEGVKNIKRAVDVVKYEAMRRGAEKVVKAASRVGLVLKVAGHGLGTYSEHEAAKESGNPIGYVKAGGRELRKSYIDPVHKGVQVMIRGIDRADAAAGRAFDRAIEPLSREIAAPLHRSVEDLLRRGTGY